jgi:hypothetical protein
MILRRRRLLGIALNKPSYYVLTDGSMHPFELSNTPLVEFARNGQYSSGGSINGAYIYYNTIRELSFGTSYLPVKNITDDILISVNFTSLRKVDIMGFGKVTKMKAFLSNLPLLTDIDFSPLGKLEEISGVAVHLDGITKVDLAGLSGLKQLKGNTIRACQNLVSVDASGLTSLEQTMHSFISECPKLLSVDLSGLTSCRIIGGEFLYQNASLTSVDLSALVSLEIVGNYFLGKCSSLTSVTIGNVDWSAITVTSTDLAMIQCPNTSDCKIHAASQALGEAFKAKIGDNISNWTIVVDN